MGDMGEVFKEHTKIKKHKHAKWKEDHIRIIKESGMDYFSLLAIRVKNRQ